jgi:glutamine---fructose-6-phosphate transaminase (isomerizing)
MCGIFGHVGRGTSERILIESLKRLEYRGYDSWGIARGYDEAVSIRREIGRITDAAISDEGDHSPAEQSWGGIAHTRWATHGAPTVENAHPHAACDGKLALVHNGIIENHSALREMLQKRGHVFTSQTDTEVIAHLIDHFLRESMPLQDAFLSAMKLIEGTYGIAVIWADEPGKIFVARKGSPMVLGLGEDSMMVSSDPAALVAHTQSVIYLEDGEAAILRADGYETHDLDAVPVTKTVQEIAYDLPAIERGGFDHFMLKEIYEQPETIRNALRGRILRSEGTAKLGGVDEDVLRKTQRCHIVACGTSWHAALVGKYLIENLARIPTQVSYAAEFRYANPVVEPGTLMIALTQSGETADTLAAVREGQLRGAKAMGICNVVGSTIARECGQGVYIHAGPEIGVASTKAFTGQLSILALLATHMGRMRGMSLRDSLVFIDALEALSDQIGELLECNDVIRQIAAEYAEARNFLYVGRLYEYPVALEGALKLKEISYIHAEGIPAAELKHGPIALIDPEMPTVVLATQQGILNKMKSNIEEIRARGGRILAIARQGDEEIPKLAEHTIFVPPTLDPLTPILSVIPLQLIAYHIAVLRGCDVDRPRNLAKSVTVE